MAISLDSISKGKTIRAPRMVVLGTDKAGKSVFASQAPDPIFLPMKQEEGIDDIDAPKFPVCESYADVIAAIGVLCNEDHNYKTAVLDSTSTLEPLIWKETCKNGDHKSIEDFGYAKGYVYALDQWRELIDGLDYLRNNKNMVIILIGHVTVKTFTDPMADSYDQYRWDIHVKAADAMMRWCDCCLFVSQRISVKKEDLGFNKTRGLAIGDSRRFLYTQKRPSHPGGGRGVYGHLPYELDLSWPTFQAAVTEANGKGE